MANFVKTNIGRKKRLDRYMNEIENLPNITGIAVGDGGRDEVTGALKTPLGDELGLYNEVLRLPVYFEVISELSAKFVCFLDSTIDNILQGKDINEIGLIDSEGDFITLETFNLFGDDGFPSKTKVTLKTQITVE
ncbi:MAG: hypothetical protein ACRC6E_09205 [Fusobacteriaceae bacterium]